MKAIICPQCGGVIDKVSEGQTIAGCDYCGAKVFIQPAEKQPPEPAPRDTLHIPLENYKPIDDYNPVSAPEPEKNFYVEEPVINTPAGVMGTVAVVGMILLGLVFMGFIASKRSSRKQDLTSTPAPYRTATPYQRLTVEPVTNEDAISLPKPVIPRNLKLTKRMDIEVYVSVDEQGNVYDASAYTDIDSLNKIMIEAAKQAKFRPSPTNQRTSGVLIYTIGPR